MLVTKMAVTNISKLTPTHFVYNIRHQHRCGHQILFTWVSKYSLISAWIYSRVLMLQEDILSIRWIVNYSRIANREHFAPSTLNKVSNHVWSPSVYQIRNWIKCEYNQESWFKTYFMISTKVIVLFAFVLIASSRRWTYGMLDRRYLGTEGFSNSYWICRVSSFDATVCVLLIVWLFLAPIMWIFWNCFNCSIASQFPELIVDDLSRPGLLSSGPFNLSVGTWCSFCWPVRLLFSWSLLWFNTVEYKSVLLKFLRRFSSKSKSAPPPCTVNLRFGLDASKI